MDAIINEVISPDLLMQFEKKYKQEQALGSLSPETTFEYAWCLIRSIYSDDWNAGFKLLKQLFEKGDQHAKRDYLYYMAIAKYKLKQYDEALKYCNGILAVQPQNHQVKELKAFIEQQMKKEGLLGMAVVGGASLVLGVGAVALGIFAATRGSK